MRDALTAAKAGDERAELAIDMYVYRVQKAIGSYYAAMTRTDAVVMTAGIGENSADLRERIFSGLAHMGNDSDRDRNQVEGAIGVNRIISIDDSPIKICVVTTDEEMRIARETDSLVSAGALRSPPQGFSRCVGAARQRTPSFAASFLPLPHFGFTSGQLFLQPGQCVIGALAFLSLALFFAFGAVLESLLFPIGFLLRFRQGYRSRPGTWSPRLTFLERTEMLHGK